MVEAILQEAGYRTGLTISPHLQNVNERIRINGCPISDKQLDAVLSKVDALAKHWGESHLNLESGELPLTYFEAVLAAAFLHFKDENVGVEIVEGGLGVRYLHLHVLERTAGGIGIVLAVNWCIVLNIGNWQAFSRCMILTHEDAIWIA